MSAKINRATHGPSMTEIVLGVVLSVILGVAIAAALLILRPVETVKELPKEPAKNVVYYIEGSKDSTKGRAGLAKRKSFAEGQSVTLTEDEINAVLGAQPNAVTPGAPGKTPEKPKDAKGKEAPPPASDEMLALGAPNVRIKEGDLQVGVPITINALGLGQKVIVQAHGGFVKTDSGFVYEPSTLYFGSCPVHRLPFLSGFVRKKAIDGQPIPEDIKTSWAKLANVAIEGSTLKLTMP
jgi:hypothetical protein